MMDQQGSPPLVTTPTHMQEKARIGLAAAELVHDFDLISINAGTTALSLAKCLLQKRGLKIWTADITIAQLLSKKTDFEVIIGGGHVQRDAMAGVSSYSDELIRSFRFKKAFLGVRAVNPEDGLMTGILDQAMTGQAMIECSERVVVIANSSKFHKRTGAVIAPITSVDILITDRGIENYPSLIKDLRSMGIKLIIA